MRINKHFPRSTVSFHINQSWHFHILYMSLDKCSTPVQVGLTEARSRIQHSINQLNKARAYS